MRKKFLSLALAATMTMSLFVVGAGATSFKDDKDIMNKDAVEKMVSLNIINGRDNGQFDPKGTVTRAEMCKMICIALSGGNDRKPGSSPALNALFTDTKDHWAQGYIEYCVNQNIVAGMGDKTFAPDKGVTPTQAAKMLLVALGYDAVSENFTGTTWAINTNTIATQKDLYDELGAVTANDPMTRDNAAQMVHNFCNAYMVKYDYGFTGNGSNIVGVKTAQDTKDTVLSKYYKLVTVIGTITGISYEDNKKEFGYTVKDADSKTNTYYSTTDYSDLYGMKVELLYKDKNNNGSYNRSDDSVYDINNDDSKVMAKGTMDDFAKYDVAKNTLKFADVTYDTENTVTSLYAFTGVKGPNLTVKDGDGNLAGVPAPYKVTLIDSDDNGKIDLIVVTPFTVAKVTYIGNTSATFTPQAATPGTSIGSIDNKDFNGYTGMAKDDLVAYYAKENSATNKQTVEKLDILTGKITSTKGSGTATKYMIDGKWYSKASNLSVSVDNNDTINYVAVGGVMYYAKVTEAGETSKDVVTVIDKWVKTEGSTQDAKAKLIFADGTKKDVVIGKIDGSENTVVGGAVNAGIIPGNMYTYKLNKDSEYELKKVDANNLAGHDRAVVNSGTAIVGKSVAGYELADNAVVLIVADKGTSNSTPDGKIYTGKEIKNTNKTYGTRATVLVDKVNGFEYATIAVVHDANALPTITSASNYAYMTDDARTEINNGDTYRILPVWTKDGQKDLKEKTTDSLAGFVEGTIVSYDTDGKDLVKNVEIPTVTTAAVTGWDNVDKIQLTPNNYGGNREVDAKDTTVLYVNSKDNAGVAGGTISLADDSNGYTNNVRYIGTGETLDLLVVDVNNKMEPVPNGTKTVSKDISTATLNTALQTYNEVTINGDYNLDDNLTVPANKKLIVSGTLDTKTHSVDVNGTLDVTTLSKSAAGTMNVNANGTLKAATLTMGVGTLNVTGTANVTGNATVAVGTTTAVTGTMTVTGTLTANAAITGNGTLTAGTISAYNNAQVKNIVVTGDVASATVLGAYNYTFKGNVTAALTFNAASVVTFEKAVAIPTVLPTANATVTGAKIMFKVAPTGTLETTLAGCFVNSGTTALAADKVADIALNVFYTNTANAIGAATVNGWVKA